MAEPIAWKGNQAFFVAGTDHEDDALIIDACYQYKDLTLSLVMPTLCITYADQKFANAIGGVQKDYPDSAPYGPGYFNPPVVIDGSEAINKHTWIRGASRVTIGPSETVIEWHAFRRLVIPRLRIKAREKVKVVLGVPEVMISESEPFFTKVMQFSDGRHVGGVYITKRHPKWKPTPEANEYKLWIRAIDGETRRPIVRAKVGLYQWRMPKDGGGGFQLEAVWYTNEMGVVDIRSLPCSDKKLLIMERSPWLPRTWRFRPLPGQDVRQIFRLWKGVGHKNGKKEPARQRAAGAFYEPIYHVEARDTLKDLASIFCYKSAEELARANNLGRPFKLYLDQALRLTGWLFIKNRPAGPFERIDQEFCLRRGWARAAQRTLHDDPGRAYEHEVVAIPTGDFVRTHKLRKDQK